MQGQQSSSRPRSPRGHHVPDPRPSMLQPSPHAASSSSGNGSFDQFPFHSTTGSTPSSQSHVCTPDTLLTPPTSVESPHSTSTTSDKKAEPLAAVDSTVSHSSSSDEQLPTRASIRAWAKATPAGPPRYTPSPAGSALFAHGSDENFDRESITRSAGHSSVSSPRSETTSSDEGSSGSPPLVESSGNLADVESAGSGSDNHSGHGAPSPSTIPPQRPPVVPHPPTQLRTHSDSSESVAPAIVVSHTHSYTLDQQERLERRGQRHPHSSGRRRHRDRERRPRSSNLNGSPNPAGHTHEQQPPPPHRSPLRIIPDVRLRLPPPPPPLPPVRPLHLLSGGFDVLDEISRMLTASRRPLLRTRADMQSRPRKENDVLDDICTMIQMQIH